MINALQLYFMNEKGEPKLVSFSNNEWAVKENLYPKEMKFISILNEMVSDYNRRWKEGKPKNDIG